MESQLSLGFGEARPAERLFFALMPDAAAIEAIGTELDALRRSEPLSARPLLPQRLHVTLHHLGDFAGIPPSVLEGAHRAAAQVDVGAFDVRFDRVGSFGGRPRRHPLVLRGGGAEAAPAAGADNVSLFALQRELGLRLARAGLGHDDAFVPHLTLMYDALQLPDRPVAPVCWRVRDFVLIRSFLGQTRYQFEGRWPLC
ncbi:2'-5' RNA ligase family protein [Stenotrophomonas sp. MMGLT7]|uniref:2'-5' RNA ligase family protein n=1 Tax=Stenotrophomonas sp. MMGLT7 TaxID=2901227 RepID=UPI001E53755B|nr:2'-5' RNA ligase family protein [Stenotrophomonas sp. MMGLT7]MCD7097371.1 2'-5' RNA ligase family protein [Stenotrophomonas sp. MMGLT7]